MKSLKLILSIVIIFGFTLVTFGQFEKGKLHIGGASNFSFSYGSSRYTSDNESGDLGTSLDLGLSPSFGIFIAKGFALGVELPISFSKDKAEDDDITTTEGIVLSPFVRYYFGSGKIKPLIFSEFGIGYVYQVYDPSNSYYETDTNSAVLLTYGLGGGAAFLLNDNVSLELELGYSSSTIMDISKNHHDEVDYANGFVLKAGFFILL